MPVIFAKFKLALNTSANSSSTYGGLGLEPHNRKALLDRLTNFQVSINKHVVCKKHKPICYTSSMEPSQPVSNFELNDIAQDYKRYVRTEMQSQLKQSWLIMISSILGIISISAYFYFWSILPVRLPDYFGMPLFFSILALFAIAGFKSPPNLYANAKLDLRHLFMQQAASRLGFSYQPKGDTTTMQGSSFDLGHARAMTDVIAGFYHNYQLQISLYTATYGYDRDGFVGNYTIFTFDLPRPVPALLLCPSLRTGLSWNNRMFSKNKAPIGTEPVVLEGQFNAIMSLDVQTGYQVMAREIFTPDYMLNTIEDFQEVRIEVSGNQFHVIVPIITNKQKFTSCLDWVEQIVNHMSHYLLREIN